MTQTVPADIAAAIDAYADAHHAVIKSGSEDLAHRLGAREIARERLDAAILHHLRAYAEMKAALERIEQGV